MPPFLLCQDGDGPGLVLVTPFANRPRLTSAEAAIVQAVAGRLGNIGPASGPAWIDAITGVATPATLGDGQLRRKLFDCAKFSVRVRPR